MLIYELLSYRIIIDFVTINKYKETTALVVILTIGVNEFYACDRKN